jgi:hypothetical protein
MESSRWTAVQKSEFPWEPEALSYLRTRLPDAAPLPASETLTPCGADLKGRRAPVLGRQSRGDLLV